MRRKIRAWTTGLIAGLVNGIRISGWIRSGYFRGWLNYRVNWRFQYGGLNGWIDKRFDQLGIETGAEIYLQFKHKLEAGLQARLDFYCM
jgi:hypothetical protein